MVIQLNNTNTYCTACGNCSTISNGSWGHHACCHGTSSNTHSTKANSWNLMAADNIAVTQELAITPTPGNPTKNWLNGSLLMKVLIVFTNWQKKLIITALWYNENTKMPSVLILFTNSIILFTHYYYFYTPGLPVSIGKAGAFLQSALFCMVNITTAGCLS